MSELSSMVSGASYENNVLRTSLERWLNQHPEFKHHPSTADLQKQLTQVGRPQTLEDIQTSSQTLIGEIQALQLSIHEAGHLVAMQHFIDAANIDIVGINFDKHLGNGGIVGETVSGGVEFHPLNQWPQTDQQHLENALMTRAGKYYEERFERELQGISINSTDNADNEILNEIIQHFQANKQQFLKEIDQKLASAGLDSKVLSVALTIYDKLKQDQYQIPVEELS